MKEHVCHKLARIGQVFVARFKVAAPNRVLCFRIISEPPIMCVFSVFVYTSCTLVCAKERIFLLKFWKKINVSS